MPGSVDRPRLAGPAGFSLALHFTLLAVVVIGARQNPPEPLPPIYKVNIIAAPPGERAIGEVRPEETTPQRPTTEPPAVVPPPPPEAAIPLTRSAPPRTNTRATPVQSSERARPRTPAPRAGGGPIGGSGTDVATVQTEGIDFPFPGYLNNIVRQVALNFRPNDTQSQLRAEVMFLIHRDGSVSNFRFVTRSGAYAFDLEAQGAVEAAARNFGPLPAGFGDDVLPVVFSFDPRFLR